MQNEIQELKAQIAALVQNRGRPTARRPPASRTRTPPIMDPEWKRGSCFECGATDHIIAKCPVRTELREKYGEIPEGHKTLYQRRQEMLRKQHQTAGTTPQSAPPRRGTTAAVGQHTTSPNPRSIKKTLTDSLPMPQQCDHDNSDLKSLEEPKPFGWAVMRREPIAAIQGGE